MAERKIPLRKCLGCDEMIVKKGLMRVVKTSEGEIRLDPTGKLNGRGAYICHDKKCFDLARKKKGFERSLKTAIPDDVYESLLKELEGL